jgi:Uma2 family endonuclease
MSTARLVLRDVPWDTYVALRDPEANDHIRMTYDRGKLELMAPSREHERGKNRLGQFVEIVCEEFNADFHGRKPPHNRTVVR